MEFMCIYVHFLELYGIHMRNPKNNKSAGSFLINATINSFSLSLKKIEFVRGDYFLSLGAVLEHLGTLWLYM